MSDDKSTISDLPDSPARPKRIGPYRIREFLGEGGMGTLYLAEQTEPVRRRVALKLIKLGMDTREVIARFESERQALALMNHPHVAAVYDAGATEQGRPYFAMEHVPGEPITEYCDKHHLSLPERLDLFMQVCHAIQHAHQKGIIHRDIKPSNVLVMYQDGKPVPKVIDFGVAKAINQRLTEKTVFTEQGQLIGTPAYMSPEQAEMTALDVDTRTDIYSLGVLLYELLTGMLPFDPKSLRGAGFEAIQRIIREVEPSKPSTKLSTLLGEPPASTGADNELGKTARDDSGSSIRDIARNRRADPRTLTRLIRGDLDWVTMKALEKDRTRRYATASDFAADILRHLRHEPVVAGPPSQAYRVRKFVRRNRAGVAAAGVIAGVLVAATAVSIGFALSEADQRRIADVEATRAEKERGAAENERAVAKAVNDFLTEDLLAAVAPSSESGKGKDVLMRDVLDEAAERIEEASRVGGRFEEMPLVEASIRATLGSTYRLLGEYAAAEPHLERARLLRRRELGEEHPSTLRSMNNLALLYKVQGRYDEAESLQVKTLEIKKRVLGEEHWSTLNSMDNLAILYRNQGRYDEAEPLYIKTLELRKHVLGEEHPSTLWSMTNLAEMYEKHERSEEAEPLLVKALEIPKRILGDEHQSTLFAMMNLADLYVAQERFEEAETLQAEAVAASRRTWEEGAWLIGAFRGLHGGTLVKLHRYPDAEEALVEAYEILMGSVGPENEYTTGVVESFADLYTAWHESEPDNSYAAKAAEWRAKLPKGQTVHRTDGEATGERD